MLHLLGDHSSDPPPLFLKGGVNFDYLPQRGGESEKLKKGDGSMVQWLFFLKGWGERRGLALPLFNFFKVYHFYI